MQLLVDLVALLEPSIVYDNEVFVSDIVLSLEEVTNFLAVSLCIRNILAFLLKFKAERILRLIVAFDDVDDLMPLLVLLILHYVFASSQNVDKNLGLDALDAKRELACFAPPSLHLVVCF